MTPSEILKSFEERMREHGDEYWRKVSQLSPLRPAESESRIGDISLACDAFKVYIGPACEDDEIESAVAAERARILAAIQAIKPGESPYTRKSWNDERIGEMRMWGRVVKLLEDADGN